jgi:hypothetical protein
MVKFVLEYIQEFFFNEVANLASLDINLVQVRAGGEGYAKLARYALDDNTRAVQG